eukprot:scaffold1594_cov211-Skeletonema_marinoi.AAC.4
MINRISVSTFVDISKKAQGKYQNKQGGICDCDCSVPIRIREKDLKMVNPQPPGRSVMGLIGSLIIFLAIFKTDYL